MLFALALTVGRSAALFPTQLEALLNRELASREIEVEGLEAGWRITNPIFKAERVKFPQGFAREVEIEVAVFESLVRMQFVARRLLVEHVEANFELKPREQDFDLLQIIERIQSYFEWIRHTDELTIAGIAMLQSETGQQHWDFTVRATNLAGNHRYRAKIAHRDDAHGGSAEFRADAIENPLDSRDGDYQMTLHATQLPIDLPLLTRNSALPQLRLNGEAGWTRLDGNLRGRYQSNLARSSEELLAANLRVAFKQDANEPVRFRVFAPTFETADVKIELNDWTLAFVSDRLIGMTKNLRVQELTPVAIEFMRDNQAAVRWLTGTDVRSTLERLEFVLDPSGFHWYADARRTRLKSYKQQPEMRVGANNAYGSMRQFAYEFDNTPSGVFLDAHFDTAWEFASASGTVLMDARQGEFGMALHDIVVDSGGSEGAANDPTRFDVASILQRETEPDQINVFIREPITAKVRGGMRHIFGGDPNYRIALVIESENTLLPASQMSDFIPSNLLNDLQKWRDQYVRDASFFGTNVRYMTYRDPVVATNQREINVGGRFTNGTVTYQSKWPELTNVGGTWQTDSDRLIVRTDRATIANTELKEGIAVFPWDSAASFDVSFAATTNARNLLEFIQASEIKDWLPVIDASWEGDGLISLDVQLQFPYETPQAESDTAGGIIGDHRVDFQFHDTSIVMHDLNLDWSELNGAATWRSPYTVEGAFTRAKLFERPATGTVHTAQNRDRAEIELQVASAMEVTDAATIAQLSDVELGDGVFEFTATLFVHPGTDEPSVLFVGTDLVGAELALPAPLTKEANEAIASALQLTFHDTSTELNLQSRDMNGWLRFEDDPATLKEGTLAIGAGTPVPNRIENQLHLQGAMSAWEFEVSDTEVLEVPVTLSDFKIAQLTALDQEFANVAVGGWYFDDSFDISIHSDTFTGTIAKKPTDTHTLVDAESVKWSLPSDEASPDPLDISVMDSLIPTEVRIAELTLETDDKELQSWGAWRFTVTPDAHGVEIADLDVEMPGMNIIAREPMRWDRETNATTFNGTLAGYDMAAIFDAWDIDSSVESENFDVTANVSWAGSPLAVDIESMSGRLQASAKNGRLVDVDQGGDVLRLVSLLNFSKILNRLTLDFKDVTQAGLHYDEASTDINLDDGLITFNDPLRINGPSIRLRLDGLVNTRTEELDGSLTVRIPLHKGLQTYAAYLAATNPPATVALLLGTLFISEPIKELLTANYHIAGDLNSPAITRVGTAPSQTASN